VKLAATFVVLAGSAILMVAVWQSIDTTEFSDPPPPLSGNLLTLRLADSPQNVAKLSLSPLANSMPAARNGSSTDHPLPPGIYESRPFEMIILVPYSGWQPQTVPSSPMVHNPGQGFIPIAPLPERFRDVIPN
jgi:hypothetical protein